MAGKVKYWLNKLGFSAETERGKMSKQIYSLENDEKILNECPLCGSELEYCALMQYSDVYRILKNGSLSKKRKVRREEGSMDCGFLACTNTDCDFHTNCDLECEYNKDIHICQIGSVFIYTQNN